MGLGGTIETEQTDVASLLAGTASRLRNDGLALVGIACRNSAPGAVEHRDLHELAGSLDRIATLVEAVKERLCQKCRLLDVAEHVTFGAVPKVGQKPKTRGGRVHGQEKEQETRQGDRAEKGQDAEGREAGGAESLQGGTRRPA